MSAARILLKNTETNRYLAKGGKWTDQPEAAMAFLNEIRAKDHSIYHRLSNTQVVVLAAKGVAPAPEPTPVIVNQKPIREETSVKPRKKSRIPKPALTKVNRPQSIEKRLVPHQMTEVTENRPASGSTSTESQFAKAPAFTELVTIIEAKMDVGFGNSLFIRGQGAGLSWDKGQPLNCADGTTWMWSTKKANEKLAFKLVLNDQVWAAGDDIVVEPGQSIEIVPKF